MSDATPPRGTLRVHRLGRIGYEEALAWQEDLVARKLAGDTDDHLLLLEHEPVYTLGRGARAEDLLGADERLSVPSFRISRGGGVTYHGPGQLVAYPIVALAAHGRDVHRYVRQLESALVAALGAHGIAAGVRPGLTGVWVGERKIASIGVGVRRWVSFHGIALNVAPDLDYFRAIVPCAMPEVTMTSIETELGGGNADLVRARPLPDPPAESGGGRMRGCPSMAEAADVFEAAFRRVFGYPDSSTAQRDGSCGPVAGGPPAVQEVP